MDLGGNPAGGAPTKVCTTWGDWNDLIECLKVSSLSVDTSPLPVALCRSQALSVPLCPSLPLSLSRSLTHSLSRSLSPSLPLSSLSHSLRFSLFSVFFDTPGLYRSTPIPSPVLSLPPSPSLARSLRLSRSKEDLDEAGAAAAGGTAAQADAAGTRGGAGDLQEIISKLRGYLQELPGEPQPPVAPSDSSHASVARSAAGPLPPDAAASTRLRRLLSPLSVPPPAPGAAQFQDEVSELVSAAQRNPWLEHLVRDHAPDIVAASSLRAFREREVLIDTHNRRRGTVFFVLDGEVGLIFRSQGPDPGSGSGGSAGSATALSGTASRAHATVLSGPSADAGSSCSESASGTARRSSRSEQMAEEDDSHEGWAVAGAGALFGSTTVGIDSGGAASSGGHTMPATLAQGLNFSYTLKAWGKKGGRVRCFERRAVATCLVPLLAARRRQVMQTLTSSNVLSLLPDDALGRLADAARHVTWSAPATGISHSSTSGSEPLSQDVMLVEQGAVWITVAVPELPHGALGGGRSSVRVRRVCAGCMHVCMYCMYVCKRMCVYARMFVGR